MENASEIKALPPPLFAIGHKTRPLLLEMVVFAEVHRAISTRVSGLPVLRTVVSAP